jgi:hypothetical protein
VSLKADEGTFSMVLRIERDPMSVADPKPVTIQGHRVTDDSDLHTRDGLNDLLVDQVATDAGIVNLTHMEHGIVPFGE